MQQSNSEPILYNLSLDDFIPAFTDFVLLRELIRRCPNIKLTLFVSMNSIVRKNSDLRANPQWCSLVRALPSKNIELAYHGYKHHLEDVKKTPEFALLNEDESVELLQLCERTADDVGLSFTKGFRPPRWRVSKGCTKALEKQNYLYLAGHPFYIDDYEGTYLPLVFPNSDIYYNTAQKSFLFYNKGKIPDITKYYLHRGHCISKCKNNLTPKAVNKILQTIQSLAPARAIFLSELAVMMRERGLRRL